MNKSFQLIIAFVVFLALSLMVSVSIGTGEYVFPILIGLVALGLVLVTTIGRYLPIEFNIICIGIGGFYIAGKGFAYLNAGGLLFMGEALLALGLLGYLWRLGKGEFDFMPRNPLAWALFVLGSYALLRLPFDFQETGIMALRDACVIYYTLFFFIAYQHGRNEKVQRLAPVILMACAVPGILVDFISFASPAIRSAMASFTIKGNPIILSHYDAIHPAAFGMILFLATKATKSRGMGIFYFLGMFLIISHILSMGRGANYLAFACVCFFLLLARQIKLLLAMAGGVLVMMCALVIFIEINPSVGRGRVRQIQDQLEVLVNPTKIGKAKHQDSDTAEWRLVWWTKITNDVNRQNPLFGLGFGQDIASDFHKMYFRTASVDPDIARTRGAHNAFFTMLARMGWIGALMFTAVVIIQLVYFWRAIIAFRQGLIPPSQAYLWGSNICAFVITFFQYAWEASYSAVPFWTCMGLSYAYLDQLRQPKEQLASAPITGNRPLPSRIGPALVGSAARPTA